jgi:hypothetical protein
VPNVPAEHTSPLRQNLCEGKGQTKDGLHDLREGLEMKDFSELSPEAQDLIVSAILGDFEKSGPPLMSESVRAELREWAALSGGSENDKPSIL